MSLRTLDAVRLELGALPPSEPPPHLLDKILQSRANGLRVELPRQRRDFRMWIVVGVAAAAMAFFMARTLERTRSDAEADYRDIAAALSFWPRAAMAQRPGMPPPPRYNLVHDLDASRVHGGTWTYDVCTTIDKQLTKCRSRLTVVIREAEWVKQAAWLMVQRLRIVSDRTPTAETTYVPPDTTYFARPTLRPMAWWIAGKRIGVVRLFTRDSVSEALHITGPHPRNWRTTVRLPGASDEPLVLRWARFDVALLLQALPLGRKWRGSVYSIGLIGPAPGASPFPALDFRVVGSERIEVPAGRFDCWKLDMQIGDELAMTLWASKDRGWLIKATQGDPDVHTESTLISATPPEP